MTHSDKHLSPTKQIVIKFHNLRQLKEDGTTELECCPNNEMPEDLLTKPIPEPTFQKLGTN